MLPTSSSKSLCTKIYEFVGFILGQLERREGQVPMTIVVRWLRARMRCGDAGVLSLVYDYVEATFESFATTAIVMARALSVLAAD